MIQTILAYTIVTYALIGLLNEVDREVLLQYLPKDNAIYLPELCGALRLESYRGVSE